MINFEDFRFMCDELHSLSLDMYNAKTITSLNSKFNTSVLQLTNVFFTQVDRLTGEKVKTCKDVMLEISPNFDIGKVCIDEVFNTYTTVDDCDKLGCESCWNRPYEEVVKRD